MPRDVSGLYTLPPGNPVVPGTLIEDTWANPTMSDIAVQLNGVVTRDGLLAPTAPMPFVAGTAGNPGIKFATSPATGLFLASTNVLAVAINGVNAMQWQADKIIFNKPAQITDLTGPMTLTGDLTVTGAFVANGGATLGDAAADPLTINSNVLSAPNNLTINGTARSLTLGATDLTWGGVGRAVIHASGSGGAANSGGAFFANNGGATIAAIGEYATMYGGAVTNTAAIYAVNDLDIGAGAAPTRMRVTSVGNVGVGANPLVKFQVRGATDNNIGIYSGGGSSVIHSFTDAGANTVPLLVGGNPLRLSGNGGAAVHTTLDSTGRFGIGGTPAVPFHVFGASGEVARFQAAADAYLHITSPGIFSGYLGGATLATGAAAGDFVARTEIGAFVVAVGASQRFRVSSSFAEFKLGTVAVRDAPTSGSTLVVSGSPTTAGYVSFVGSNDIRTGYIGNGANASSIDTGPVTYVAGLHSFSGVLQFNTGYRTHRTWQSLGRAFNTDFVAPAYDIEVSVSAGLTSGSMTLIVAGITVAAVNSGTAAFGHCVTGHVPAGATYRVNASGAALSTWAELR